MTQDELLRKWGFTIVSRPLTGEAVWGIHMTRTQALEWVKQWQAQAEAKAMVKPKGK